MRITQSQIYGRLAADLQRSLRATTEAQRQVTTGRKFDAVSADPLAGVDVLRAQSGMRAVAQYKRNLGEVRTRLDTEESTINQMIELIDTARSTAMQQGSATATAGTRAASAAEVTRQLEQLANLGNVRIGNEYIFAGNASTTAPFTFTGTAITYAGDAAVRRQEIAEGYVIDASRSGQSLLVTSGVAQAFADLRTALAANDQAGINAANTALETAFDNVQALLGDVGARQRALDDVGIALEATQVNLEERENAAWNVDIGEASVRLAESQQALQSALLAASKVLETNLTQYLR